MFQRESTHHVTLQKNIVSLPDIVLVTGFISNDPIPPFKELPILKPAPCGHDSYLESESKGHIATALQLYSFDPTETPSSVIIISSVKIKTMCRLYWLLHNQLHLDHGDPILFL